MHEKEKEEPIVRENALAAQSLAKFQTFSTPSVEGAVIVKGNFWIMQLNLRTIWINMLPAQWSRI